MGLFDKIKDNAKAISIRAIEEGDENMQFVQPDPAAQAQPDDTVYDEPVQDEPADLDVPETPEPEALATQESTAVKKAQPEKTETKSDEKIAVKAQENPTQEKIEPKKSKITEVPKPATNKDSRPAYTPYYKQDMKKKADEQAGKKPESKPSRVIDVTPHAPADPGKRAIFARERAAMTALAAQRRMNGSVALYVTSYLKFKTRVYINRIEYSGSFGKNILPIEDVAWIKLRHGGTGVIIETAQGKRVVMVVKPSERLAFTEAVMKVQSLQPKRAKFVDNQTVRLDQLEQLGEGIDEIEKLAKMFEKGILTQDEFEAKKKQILGI